MSVTQIFDQFCSSCQKGIVNRQIFNQINELMSFVLDSDCVPPKYNCLIDDFFDKHLSTFLLKIIDVHKPNDENLQMITQLLKISIKIFEKHFINFHVEFLKSISIIINIQNTILFKSADDYANFDFISTDFDTEHMISDFELFMQNLEITQLTKLSYLLDIILHMKIIIPLEFSLFHQLSDFITNENANPYDLTTIINALLKLYPIETEKINNYYKEAIKFNIAHNITWVVENVLHVTIENDLMKQIIDNTPRNSLTTLAKSIKNYDDEIHSYFMAKTVKENSIQSWAPCLGDFFVQHFKDDYINETNYYFIIFALKKCKFENIEIFYNHLSHYISNKDDLLALQSVYPHKQQSLLNICSSKFPISDIISVIDELSGTFDIDISSKIHLMTPIDLQNMIKIIRKLNLDSLKKLEEGLLTLEYNEARLNLLKEIHMITNDREIIQKSAENGSELGSYIYLQSNPDEITQNCIHNPDNIGFALALLHNVQKSGENAISTEDAASLFNNLTHKSGKFIFEILIKVPLLNSEAQNLTPALEIKTDWFSKLDVDVKYVFLYRIHAISILMQNQKWVKIFEATGGAETLIKIALLIEQGMFSYSNDELDIILKVAREVVIHCPDTILKFEPSDFMIAANPKSIPSISFFSEICTIYPDVLNSLTEPSSLVRTLVIDEKCNDKESIFKIIMAFKNYADIVGIMCNLCELSFDNLVEGFPDLFAQISLHIPMQHRLRLFETFSECFLKRFNFPQDPMERLDFVSPSPEFLKSTFSCFVSLFPHLDEIKYYEEIFHVIITHILLNSSIYYEPSNEFLNFIMVMLDRFSDLVVKSFPIIINARDDYKNIETEELNSFAKSKKFSGKTISTEIASSLYKNVQFRNLVLADFFVEGTWQNELQKMFANMLLFPSDIISSENFEKQFGEENLENSITKFAEIEYLSDNNFDGNIIFSNNGMILALENRPQPMNYPIILETIQKVKQSILAKVTHTHAYEQIVSRMDAEQSNPNFCIDRLFEIMSEENPDSVRLSSVSERIKSMFNSESKFAVDFLERKDHMDFLLNKHESVRKTYLSILALAYNVSPNEKVLGSILDPVNEKLCEKWMICESLLKFFGSIKINQSNVIQKLCQFAINDIENYESLHQDEGIYEKIDLSGLFDIFSIMSNETLYGQLLQIMTFNDMFKSPKHIKSFMKFVTVALNNKKELQDPLFKVLDNSIAPFVVSHLFITSIAINDHYRDRRNKQILSFINKTNTEYKLNFLSELTRDAVACSETIYEGFFNNFTLWTETFLFDLNIKIREKFTQLVWAIINACVPDDKPMMLNTIFEVLFSMIPSLVKARKSYSFLDDDIEISDKTFPEGDFFKFLRSIISAGHLQGEVIKNSQRLYKYIISLQRNDLPGNFLRIHILYFMFKVVPPEKGALLFAGFDYQNFMASLSNFVFESLLITPQINILHNILIRTPRQYLRIFFASEVFKNALSCIFQPNNENSVDFAEAILDNFENLNHEKIAREMFAPNIFKMNLEYDNQYYFKICAHLLKFGQNTLIFAEGCMNMIWDITKWVLINKRKEAGLFSTPKLPSDHIISYLVEIEALYISRYCIENKGKKSFFGKNYIEELKKEWEERSIDPQHLLNVALSQKQDTNGYFSLILSLSCIDHKSSESILNLITDMNIMERAHENTKYSAAAFINEYSQFVINHNESNSDKISSIVLREFCSQQEIYNDLCLSVARIINLQISDQIDEYITKITTNIVEISDFGDGFLKLCESLQKLGKFTMKQTLVTRANSLVGEAVKMVNKSLEQQNLLKAIKNIKTGIIFIKTLYPDQPIEYLNDIISLGMKVRQFGNPIATAVIEEIEHYMLN